MVNTGGGKSHEFTQNCNRVYYTGGKLNFRAIVSPCPRFLPARFLSCSILTMNEPLVLSPVPDSLLISADITLF